MNAAHLPGPSAGPPETPSGKGAKDENFPVGSFLIARELRPCVAAFYAFARAADDIADNGALTAPDKIARLDAMEAALIGQPGFGAGYEKSHALRAELDKVGVTDAHARALLSAFRQDAMKRRYQSFEELQDYCRRSADPVGRFLIDLHGESGGLYPYSDALCSALQVLNHLQDCADDLRTLDRCYIPRDWLEAHGGSIGDVLKPAMSPAFAATKKQLTEGIRVWLKLARQMPVRMKSARLAMESAVIIALAHKLTRRLERGDPLARRVALGKMDFALAGVEGVLRGLFGRRKAA